MLKPDWVKELEARHANDKAVMCPQCKEAKYDHLTEAGICPNCVLANCNPVQPTVDAPKQGSKILDQVNTWGAEASQPKEEE